MSTDNIAWSVADSLAASAEGWDIFNEGEGQTEIQRDDEADIFDGDDSAHAHVIARAAQGSALHRKALSVILRDNPGELTRMYDAVGIPLGGD